MAAILSAALYEALSRIGIVLPAPLSPKSSPGCRTIREYTIEQLQGPITTVAILWVAVDPAGGDRPPHLGPAPGAWPTARRDRGAVVQHSAGLVPAPSAAARRTRSTGRRGAPTDAVGAYLATLDDLAAHDPPRARREAESPRAHAARVELVDLGALQADYALARYGERHLTDAEHRRGLARWRRIRDRLRGSLNS